MNSKKEYPTKADSEGYFFNDVQEESLGISTKLIGKTLQKKVTLLIGDAIINQLTAEDFVKIKRIIHKKDTIGFQLHVIAEASLINGKKVNVQFLRSSKLKFTDINKLSIANAILNFL